jgi:uncharacterized protein (DUF1330 family)
MSLYAIAMVTVTDRDSDDPYQRALLPILRRNGGRLPGYAGRSAHAPPALGAARGGTRTCRCSTE